MIVPDNSGSEKLSIRSFGWATIRIERAPSSDAPAPEAERAVVKLETHTTEALLIYLVCQGRPLGRDVLTELLWPERSQQQARANLRVAIHRLRQKLGPYLLITRQSAGTNPDAHIDLDVALFESCLAGGWGIAQH